jgi:import inner membrane translocase subunit TIM22
MSLTIVMLVCTARRFPTAIVSGSALALTSVLLDVTGMRTTEEEEKSQH